VNHLCEYLMAVEAEMAIEPQLDDGIADGSASGKLLVGCVKLSRTVGRNEVFGMLAPADSTGCDCLDLRDTAPGGLNTGNLPGQLAGPGKPVSLVTAGIPSLVAGLLKAVPIAEGNIVELTNSLAQLVEVDEVGLGRLVFVVGFTLEIDGAAVGQRDAGPVIERRKVEPADPGGWIGELPLRQRARQQDGVSS
jgi:hypothetical protein